MGGATERDGEADRAFTDAGMNWWSGLEREVLDCVACAGPVSAAEIARRLGFSEAAATSVLAMLAETGQVRLTGVELTRAAGARVTREVGRAA